MISNVMLEVEDSSRGYKYKKFSSHASGRLKMPDVACILNIKFFQTDNSDVT